MNGNNLNEESILIEGWLGKRSKHLNSSKLRWMVLTNNCLYSYKNKQRYENPTEIFDLNVYDKIEQFNTQFYISSTKTNDERRQFDIKTQRTNHSDVN